MPASSAAGHDAAAYDAWYDSPTGRPILATEVAALRPLIEVFAQPRLEIGVGTGRFADLLGVRFGLDPSRDALMLARRRGVLVANAVGEAVPFVSRHFGAVLIAFTLARYDIEAAHDGIQADAGFVAISAVDQAHEAKDDHPLESE
ncbi:class I SAM-dependent methyltransferase [Mycobacterium canetti]|uniref:class I SAM-dependent methyltransferase n=1 Tax=Mycobacterium canetti TaxID=78331 RepID=UPI00034C6FD9|nr:class I SAM-dependent methyltransferase [Mycobacterium canetti]